MVGNDPKSKAKETKETPEGVKSNGGILYPNIGGKMTLNGHPEANNYLDGCFGYRVPTYPITKGGIDGNLWRNTATQIAFYAEASSVIYSSNTHTVQPNSIRITYIIRYVK